MSTMVYTPGQEELIYHLKKWFRSPRTSKPYYSYSGAAGTGKTTVIKEFINQLGLDDGEYICAAYVGKAVLQLLKNGLPAKTIHSLIYNVYTEKEKVVDDFGESKVVLKMKTVLREYLDPRLKLIIIDEATMVNDKMKDEILSFGIPVIFIGDMNQLPPVFGVSSVMLHPDFTLTQIMRQAEDDPIIQLSQMVLQDVPLSVGKYGCSEIMNHIDMDKRLLCYDQIICGKNKTREKVNTHIRHELLGKVSEDPTIGDKLMCRQNNWCLEVEGFYLTNGLVGEIVDIDRSKAHRGYLDIAFQPDFMNKPFEDVKLDLKYLRMPFDMRKTYGISKYDKFEYGYVISVHTSQGSGFPNVLFLDERFWDRELTKNLRYTAITRAEKSIHIVLSDYNY